MRQAIFLAAALGCAGLAPAQTPPAPHLAPSRPAVVPAGLVRENLVPFDPRQVELVWKDNRWQLLAGGVLIKDFGRRHTEGREVYRLVRELGLTQLGTVGTPHPVMEYWLAGGKAPRGPVTGLRLSELDMSRLRVDQVQEQWCVRDGPRVLFNFGGHREEAEQALAVIRRHGFTHVGHVGRSPPVMTLFVSSPDGTTPPPVAAPASFVPRTVQPGSPAFAPADPNAAGPGQAAGAPNPVVPEPLPHGRHLGATEPRPDLASLAEQVPFDWRRVQVRRDGNDWKLAAGSYVLADFGANERDARLALTAVQHYHFNQHCLVGRPTPAFSYFLVNGRAPQGVLFGVGNLPFRPEALTVKQVGGNWVIADSTQTLLDFGDRADEARLTLRAIQRHRFDHLCRIGQPPALTFFVRAR